MGRYNSIPPTATIYRHRLLAESGAEWYLAAGLGLEPRLPDPESSVLPLDDPAILLLYIA